MKQPVVCVLFTCSLSLFLLSCDQGYRIDVGPNTKSLATQEDSNDGSLQESSSTLPADVNGSPENVMNTIFHAAKTGQIGVLKFLLPPVDQESGQVPCDNDCLSICNPGNERMREELGNNYISLEDFQAFMSKGRIIGTPVIEGERAKVNFIFGKNLEQNETMNMQLIDGKWYLSSF
jgi:hypothetical protein